MYPSCIEGFAALQTAVDVHQQGFQRTQVETAQTVAQGVIAKSAFGADPALQMRVGQFTVQLLKAGQAKHKAMEERQEDARRKRSSERCGRPTSDQYVCADRNPCSAKRTTKAGNALLLSSRRLQDRQTASSRFHVAHLFAAWASNQRAKFPAGTLQ
jgi:hypothetical protein